MNKLAQGAEAVIYQDDRLVIKERLSKAYRWPQLDESLRKFRTRREAKILDRLDYLNFPAPHLRDFSDKRMSITMDFVPGEKLKDLLLRDNNFQQLAVEIGNRIVQLHQADIIHGDLTTSNLIKHSETGEVNFIDFGLSFFSEKVEDKAVDLFLLDRALESTHNQLYPEIFTSVLKGYEEESMGFETVLQRLEAVKKRGRNKK